LSTHFVVRVAIVVALGQSSKRVPTVFGMNASPKRAPIACWARHPVQWAGTTTLGARAPRVVEDSGDEGLENRSVEMESAYDRVEGALFGQAAGVPADVDDPSVAAVTDRAPPGCGTRNAGTGNSCSPDRRNGERLVTRIRS
jgi:hypothetical protein